MNKETVIVPLVCLRCHYSWWPRGPKKPGHCPGCGSPYWDKVKTKFTKAEMEKMKLKPKS